MGPNAQEETHLPAVLYCPPFFPLFTFLLNIDASLQLSHLFLTPVLRVGFWDNPSSDADCHWLSFLSQPYWLSITWVCNELLFSLWL